MIPLAVVRELERRIQIGWTGRLTVNFKDGHIIIDTEKMARADKR